MSGLTLMLSNKKVEKLLELLKEKASVKFLYRSDLFKGTKKDLISRGKM